MKSDSSTNIKNNFSSYINLVKKGEQVLILEYGKPIAQISKPDLNSADEELTLLTLERDGLVSMPKAKKINPNLFLSKKIKLTPNHSLLTALLEEREESI